MAAKNSVLRMKELIMKIKEADSEYFGKDSPSMTDREYDALVEELKMLENETGIVFSASPTSKVSGEISAELSPVRHTRPMLSANKTKSVADIEKFCSSQNVVVSWKLDGLSLILRYADGKFKQAITRGKDGIVGEDVTHTVKRFRNIPQKVNCRSEFEVRGEGVISWADFKVVGKKADDTVSHPRNVVSGCVRSSTADKGKLEHMDFIAFELIGLEEICLTKTDQLCYLASLGFWVVPHKFLQAMSGDNALHQMIESFDADEYPYPADGIIFEYDDLIYGRSLGQTSHHENRMIALKWEDELVETTFRGVELITTRTGVVSIVGIFDPISMDGAVIKRANLHNLSIFEKFQFGVGDTIKIYKANMIIPQIAENLTRSGGFALPQYCPCCGEKLTVKKSVGGVKNLYCPNEECIARNAQKIARFCDKSAMNIEGLSAVTLEKLMEHGWVKSYKDLYHISDHRDAIAGARGFGIASYNAMFDAIESSRHCTLKQFLVGIGIPLLGPQAAGILDDYYFGSWKKFESACVEKFNFARIAGISDVLTQNIHKWYDSDSEGKLWKEVLPELVFSEHGHGLRSKHRQNAFLGANVVVTGTLLSMSRKEVSEVLRMLGAVPSEHVSKNTDFLVVGMAPGGKKLGSAIKLGIPIITESQFATMLEK